MSKYPDPITTPVGVALFPALDEPDAEMNPDKPSFNVTLVLSKEDAEPLAKMITKMHKDHLATVDSPKDGGLPFGPAKDADGNETDDIAFRFRMNQTYKTKGGKVVEQRPAIFDSKGTPAPGTPIGFGSKLRVNFTPFPYEWKKKMGISLRLNGVQVIELVERGGKSAESMGFSEVDGGWSGDNNPFSEPESTEEVYG